MYRYIIYMYRYNLLEKWQWVHCTGTTQMCTGTHVQKIDSGYRYITNVYRYIYMEIARFVQELDLYARALLSTNQNGKITLEGGIKGRGHK